MGKQFIKVTHEAITATNEDGTQITCIPAGDSYLHARVGYFLKGSSYVCGLSTIVSTFGLLFCATLYAALYNNTEKISKFITSFF